MTMFGRDSIFTSLQALPFTPELAATTLRELGAAPGHRVDDFRDEDPGPDPPRDALRRDDRVRGAPALAVLRLAPTRRRCSWCCSTSTSGGPATRKLVRELEFEARAALRGSTSTPTCRATATSPTSGATRRPASRTSAGRTPGTRSPTATARSPGFPRATCELQGYAYDAKVRGARLAREVWHDPALADTLEKQAADLKRRFNRDFWVADGEYFAVALDADGARSTR